jgi:hypothetical protein
LQTFYYNDDPDDYYDANEDGYKEPTEWVWFLYGGDIEDHNDSYEEEYQVEGIEECQNECEARFIDYLNDQLADAQGAVTVNAKKKTASRAPVFDEITASYRYDNDVVPTCPNCGKSVKLGYSVCGCGKEWNYSTITNHGKRVGVLREVDSSETPRIAKKSIDDDLSLV